MNRNDTISGVSWCAAGLVVLLLGASAGCSGASSGADVAPGDSAEGDGALLGDLGRDGDGRVPEDQQSEAGTPDVAEVVEYPWDDQTLTVMTFNVMCSFCKNDPYGNEPWEARVPYFGDILTRHAPDLVGLQELTFSSEIEEIQAVAPGYSSVFVSGLSPAPLVQWTEYPDAAMLYRTDRFQLLEQGHYWLSATPDQDWAGGWAGTNLWRIVVWAKLRQVSDGREFYFLNTHFDNNVPNQENSAPLVLARTEPFAEGHPVIFTGDFNSKPSSPAYTILTSGVGGAGFHLTNTFDLAGGYVTLTNLDPEPSWNPDHRIDHIFVAGNAEWSASNWTADLMAYGPDNYFPSDHFPLSCTIGW